MNHVSLGDAIAAARRFLRLAKDLEQEAKKDNERWFPAPSAKSAAVKRSSMDLTRALAVMRRPS